MKVKEILNLINSFAPANTALSYDNTGLLLGDAEQTVTKAVVCLDATPDAIDFAKENNAGLIITHHPIIFDGLKSVLVGSAVYECLAAGISVISAHTNLDVAEGGVNDCLAKALGLKNITAVTDEGVPASLGDKEKRRLFVIVTDNKYDYTPIQDKQAPLPQGQLQYIKTEIYDYLGTNENIVQNKERRC